MVKVCSIKGCRSKSFVNGEISFCALPTKPELRKKWLKIINRPDWTPHKYSTVCSKHFEPKCFVQRGRRKVLIKDSIPTLFVPVKLKQRTATVYISRMVQTQSSVNNLDKKFFQNTIQQLRSNLQTQQNLMIAQKQQVYGVRRKVQPSEEPVNKDSKSKILACHACLTTDARFAFLGNSMLQAFQELVGKPFASTDVDLPQYFCALCRAELSKFVAFRDRCQRASELLRTLNEFDALTSDDISAVDRNLYKLTHNLNKVEVYHYNSNEVHYFSPIRIKIEDEEPALEFNDEKSGLETIEDNNECENLEILQEILNDTDNEKRTFDTGSNDTENEAEVEYLDDTEDEKEEILKESFIYIQDGEQQALEDFNDTGDKTNEKITEVFNNDEHVENETLDEEEEIEENKLEYLEMEFSDDASIDKNINSIMEQTENIAVQKSPYLQSTKRKACNAEVYYPNFDCAAFERRYQVKITVLEKEEQLKEIEDRKKESSYLNAAYKCELCGKGFKTEKPFQNHMTYHDQRTGRFSCEICHFRFPLHRRLLQHRKMHRVKYTCLQCGFVTRGRAFATRHREVHLGMKYSCMHCARSFARRSTCYNHARVYHARDNIACDQCGETFLSVRGVRLHKSRAHREKLEPKPVFKCPICQVDFESSKARDNHASTASVVKHMTLHPCAVCGENCESGASLNEHAALKHSPDQFRCDECDKTFSSAASFDTHTVRKHREPVRRARTASPRRTKVCCEICGLFVMNEAVLRQHQITHAADKPFKCPYCSRGFAVKHARNFHIRTHTGERPFQCEQCPLAFALHTNLQRHHRVVHLGQRRSFPCELCGKTFTTRYSVKLHVNTVHNGVPWPKRDRRKRKTKK